MGSGSEIRAGPDKVHKEGDRPPPESKKGEHPRNVAAKRAKGVEHIQTAKKLHAATNSGSAEEW